jgi:acyl transferase domain-containing protein
MSATSSARSNTAFLFPGQGGFDGEALRLAQQKYPEVRRIFDRLDSVTTQQFERRITDMLFGPRKADLRDLLDNDPWASQVAIYGAGLAAYEVLTARGVRPGVLVGHSLGEITALVAAGVYSVEDGARVVLQRVAAIENHRDVDGRMVALSTDADRAGRVLGLLDEPMLAIATENHDEQTVVSGPAKVLDRVVLIAEQLGIGSVTIDAPFAFHTPALAPAAPEFAAFVRKLDQGRPTLPVYSPILQRYYEPEDAIGDLLAEHFVKPVRFASAIRHLQDSGITIFLETGGRSALSKLVTRLTKGTEVRSLATLGLDRDGGLALDATLETLRVAGLADAGRPPSLAQLLAPSAPTDLFEAYWREQGDVILEQITSGLSAYRDRAAAPAPVPSPAASAPAAAPRTPAPAVPDRADVLVRLRTLYADALEYPEEVFEGGAQLEAELGVDSVKQLELLTRVSQTYGLPARESDFRLASYDTLDKVVDFVVAELIGRPVSEAAAG